MTCTLDRKPVPVFQNDNFRTPLEKKLGVNRLASCLPKYAAKSRRNKTPTAYPLRRDQLFSGAIHVKWLEDIIAACAISAAVFSWTVLILAVAS